MLSITQRKLASLFLSAFLLFACQTEEVWGQDSAAPTTTSSFTQDQNIPHYL